MSGILGSIGFSRPHSTKGIVRLFGAAEWYCGDRVEVEPYQRESRCNWLKLVQQNRGSPDITISIVLHYFDDVVTTIPTIAGVFLVGIMTCRCRHNRRRVVGICHISGLTLQWYIARNFLAR